MPARRNRRRTAALGAALAALAVTAPLLAGTATAAPAQDSPTTSGSWSQAQAEALARRLVRASSGEDAHRHLEAFQRIADRSDGTRVAGSQGHDLSARYVESLMRAAGYRVTRHEFDFVYTETVAQSLTVVSPTPRDVPINLMTYTANSPEGGVTAPVAVVPEDGTTGCEPGDFAAGAFTGTIALIQRGGCTFAVKQANAADAGAVGAIIYNNTDGPLNGTIGDPEAGRIPTGGITQADGEALAAEAAAGEVVVTLDIREFREDRTTYNVIAETRGGDADNTVFLGAHLDSVAAGPGINDNGSGSAGILEVALELARSGAAPANKVKFAWWSAEEYGLLGSEAYVADLTPEQQEQIRLYLNFDMIASPNAGYFVYDGDDSDGVGSGPGPEGSAQIEHQINSFLDSRGIAHEGTDFTGRSDYGPFIEIGIPAGGTFTGAEGIMTAEQAEKFGGEAGLAYDPCYHQECDTLENIDLRAFDVNIDVIANAVGRYAHDLSTLDDPVPSTPSEGDAGSGGGLHDGHDHPTE
ncbi:M28 family metallopeptidase [Allostreptomyces psammosilenae]|uniref:Zn-dependent M28 family amino/carboxypeptidase n=1 Tax=Allostreptomyces psammosilenae TaxID=1892865 RepID=A0A852ZW91_9ACTN|nr:M28 family metallopeptidase [Allostreptomyces psammosilenae]NYI05520.1 Zn-dependent M28 family amino/carboxypeptidase [Allostreptomyces psammosilenae]